MPYKDPEYKKKYVIENKERLRKLKKEKNIANKKEIFNHYGNSCNCCGEDTPQFLTIDHINNDGYLHKKELNLSSGTCFYAWIIRNKFPKGLQTLCMNCNFGKKINKGVCPHAGDNR